MIKLVLFDMDGLVVDTEKYYQASWIIAAKEFGFQMSRETALALRSCTREVAKPMLEGLFGEGFDFDRVRARRRELVEEAVKRHGIDRMPYVDELLALLKEKGIMAHIVTATDEERCKRFLSLAGLRCSFDKITCANMVKIGKPEPDVYLYALERAGVRADEVLALEDSPNGVKSASRAGLSVIMVSPLDEGEEIKEFYTKKVADLSGVIDYLNQLEKTIS